MKKGRTLQFMLILTLMSMAVFVSAQVALAADPANLAGLIRGFGLPQDKTNQALTLTSKFLGQVEQSSSALLKLLGSKAPGQQDANLNDQINLIQRDLNLKKQQYQLDLADLVGADNANKVIVVVDGAIPAVLQQTAVTAAQPGHDPQAMASMNMPGMNNTPGTAPAEAPLGNGPMTPGPNGPNLDIQVNEQVNAGMGGMAMDGGTNNMTAMMDMMMKNMTNMKSMMDMMMGGMGMMGMGNMSGSGTNSMPGMGNMGGSSTNMPGMGAMPMNNDMYRQLLNQLLANNALIQQQLSAATNGSTNPATLQQLNQLMANQNSLIQMLIMMQMQMNNSGSGMSSGSGGGMGMGMM